MKIMVQGKLYRSISAAARAHDISQSAVYKRMRGLGDNPTQKEIDDCFTREAITRVPSKPIMAHGKKFNSISEAAAYFNLIPATVTKRLRSIGSEPSQEAIDDCFKPAEETMNVQLSINGEHFASIAQACKHHGITNELLRGRIRRVLKNRSIEMMSVSKSIKLLSESELSECFRKREEAGTITVFGIKFDSFSAASLHFGVPLPTALYRYNRLKEKSPKNINRCFIPKFSSKEITVKGISYRSISEAASCHNLLTEDVINKIKSLGINPSAEEIDRCFITPLERDTKNTIEVNGRVYRSMQSACRAHGVASSVILGRARRILKSRPIPIDVKNIIQAQEYLTSDELNSCFLKKSIGTKITVFGIEFDSFAAATRYFGIPLSTVLYRYRTLEDKSPESINQCFIK